MPAAQLLHDFPFRLSEFKSLTIFLTLWMLNGVQKIHCTVTMPFSHSGIIQNVLIWSNSAHLSKDNPNYFCVSLYSRLFIICWETNQSTDVKSSICCLQCFMFSHFLKSWSESLLLGISLQSYSWGLRFPSVFPWQGLYSVIHRVPSSSTVLRLFVKKSQIKNILLQQAFTPAPVLVLPW